MFLTGARGLPETLRAQTLFDMESSVLAMLLTFIPEELHK